jgi:hypothetical protein
MNDIAEIREKITQEVFDYRNLLDCLRHYSKPRDRITRLLAAGDVVRVRKGLYVFAAPYRKQAVAREQLANLIYGPSYVSLDYALGFHGLIPERVETVTSVAVGRARVFNTPFGLFTYQHLAPAKYSVGGVLRAAGSSSFLIASPEKALADKVWFDKRFSGTRVGDFSSYLFDDLRMDNDSLRALDAGILDGIGQAYASFKVGNLISFIRRLRRIPNE